MRRGSIGLRRSGGSEERGNRAGGSRRRRAVLLGLVWRTNLPLSWLLQPHELQVPDAPDLLASLVVSPNRLLPLDPKNLKLRLAEVDADREGELPIFVFLDVDFAKLVHIFSGIVSYPYKTA